MSDLRRERLQHEQRLLSKQYEAKELKVKCEPVRDLIRSKLDPYIALERIEILVAAEAMEDLVQMLGRYHQLLAEIETIKQDLGRG